MANLYNRLASLNIAGRLFKYPPFSIEFEQTLKIGVPSSTIAKLYNPAPETIKACEKKGTGPATVFPHVIISAGYEQENGTCVIGKLYDYKVDRKGVDTILECKISDETLKWQNALVNVTYRQMMASAILTAVLAKVGISTDGVTLGSDKLYSTFTATTFRSALQKITADTNSEYYFSNGTLKVQSKTARNVKKVYVLSPSTGLLETPQKTQRGYKFKTLFFYKINVGDYVKLQTSKINTTLKIIQGKKTFSTFANAFCDWEAVS